MLVMRLSFILVLFEERCIVYLCLSRDMSIRCIRLGDFSRVYKLILCLRFVVELATGDSFELDDSLIGVSVLTAH